MFFIDNKLEARVNELKEYRYRDRKSLGGLLSLEDNQGKVNPELPSEDENWELILAGQCWSGRDRYLWLKTELVIPEEWKGKKAVGLFDYGITGDGNNSGFESLLYVNGQPFQGVDMNHKEVFFPADLYGEKLECIFRLWSGLEGGGVKREQVHKINYADLAWLDEKTDDLYYMGFAIIDAVKTLKNDDPTVHELRRILDEAFLCIDWSYPGSEEFYQSVHEADDMLNQQLDEIEKNASVQVKCIGHTHIDVAWLWRLNHTREKCSRSFSTVIRLMEQFPEYIFLQTQPQLYEYVKKDFPDLYQKIKEKAAAGNWEVDGGMWVEADCNLTSGESLTRQILMCRKFMMDEFGKVPSYLWLPDVFGYSWALPQILKKSGIDMFMTTKISWNQYNRMPHDTFRWVGMDGSEVLTHFITTPAPWDRPDSWFYTYNGQLIPNTVKGVWDAYQDKAVNKELLISYGYGDGGGGVNRDMLELRRRIDKIPGIPELKTSTAKEYFEHLKDTFKHTKQYVHTWDGELYLEYHRGTYTSQAYNKRMNRKMEFLYRETEWLTAMAAIVKGDVALARQDEMREGWKILLTHQFHDIIPGSSIHEVYEDSRENYKQAEAIADTIKEDALEQLISAHSQYFTIVNNSGWDRDGIVSVPYQKDAVYVDGAGNVLESQDSAANTLVKVGQVPAMGMTVISRETGVKQVCKPIFFITNSGAESPFYCIKWNEAGQLTDVYDKENDIHVIPEGKRANVFQLFEDKPLGNDAWDIDLFYQEKMKEVDQLISVECVEQGPLRAVIRFTWSFLNSKITQNMMLYAQSRRIDFETKMDFYEHKKILKVAFPVDIRTTYATYDIQYGNVRRANHWNTSWDQAKFETVAHRFADLSEQGYGVSLLNDCKYGHDIKGNVMRLTLVKAATHPDPQQDQGEHYFTYSLFPHKGDFAAANTVQEAYGLNQPLYAVEGSSILGNYSFLSLDNEYVEIDAIKLSEDGKSLVVRFHEYIGARHKVTIAPHFSIQGYQEADLMEQPQGEYKEEKVIRLEFKPYEIKTVLIDVKKEKK
ncbi:alpha-mannosidase [Anaeromicropila populeti]|uniref:Alpha-mannosidase n=1 Tax=Anaeromicropila populeti TaxID=37658 RepID=A0A1I6IFT9_9FIRM|nr:alpha-mannosidase [Anaeromicropila populeti]SFR65657.1 alpha-mannosidase [Anaeromicropila populeti]